MADITMCEGIGCQWAGRCYRATANPNPYRQSYFLKQPNNGDDCDEFWPATAPNLSKPITEQQPKDKP